MYCIVKQKRKGTDTIYAYESESYWVPNVGPRSRRKLIGKYDPVTGEIVPTGKRGRQPKAKTQPDPADQAAPTPETEDDLSRTKQQLIEAIASKQAQEDRISALAEENRTLRAEIAKLNAQMSRMESSLRKTRSAILKNFDNCLDAFQQNTEAATQ